MTVTSQRRAWAAFVVALSVTACDPLPTALEPEPNPIENLDEARAVWESKRPSHYELDFQWSCFCASIDPVTLEVRDGVAVSGFLRATGTPLSSTELATYRSVDGLFDFLEEARDRPADSIDTEFDQTFGYPTNAYVDYETMAADEEMAFRVDAVRPLR